MRRRRRRLCKLLSAVALTLFVGTLALWVWTEPLGRAETIVWGEAGVYRSVAFHSDEVHYKVLNDPGFAATPLSWDRRRGGWLRPPPPSAPAALPPGSVTWVMPSPASLDDQNRFMTVDAKAPTTRRVFVAGPRRGVPSLGFEGATFPGWYGPNTSLTSYRLSYFVAMLPAGAWSAVWLVRLAVRRRRAGRYGPGHCRSCGYDLRASAGRCPECGAAAASPEPPASTTPGTRGR